MFLSYLDCLFQQYIGAYNRMHPALQDKIHEMVLHGVTTRADMRRHLESLVRRDFKDAHENDAAYHPSDSVISSQMYTARLSMRYDKIDEVNVIGLVGAWKDAHPDDFTFYRPRTEGPTEVESMTDHDEEDVAYQEPHIARANKKNSLLFIHQSKAQRMLLKKYNNMVLMDATYRTCRLALPLFIMAVKTNVAYLPVATFIIETEDRESIQEALSILRGEWDKHGIEVQNWMVDCCQAEIKSIEEEFPDSTVYICDFHRGQAWVRWLCTKANGCLNDYNQLMSIFKRCANAITLESFRAAEAELKDTRQYEDNDLLRNYWARWEAMKEVHLKYVHCK